MYAKLEQGMKCLEPLRKYPNVSVTKHFSRCNQLLYKPPWLNKHENIFEHLCYLPKFDENIMML